MKAVAVACVLFAFFSAISCDSLGNGYGPENVTQHSGYITVRGTDSDGAHLFYWMFESRANPQTDPFVIWLTGGPGCSSLMALMAENGPYMFDKNGKMITNQNSWNSHANILWVDQPVGTGFSYADDGDYDTNENQVAADLYAFLTKFYQMYPQYSQLPFFIVGESYAGHYVPAFGHKVWSMNQNNSNPTINLKGIGIGNGWTWPETQYAAYAEFAYINKLITLGEYNAFNATYVPCKQAIDAGLYDLALEICAQIEQGVIQDMGVTLGYDPNVYDIRIPCAVQPLCYDFSDVTNFFNDPTIQQSLGAKKQDWESCDTDVYMNMLDDWMIDMATVIPDLLEGGVPVLVYSGDQDYICNYKGGEAWTSEMEWAGQSAFNAAPLSEWTVGSQSAGKVKSVQGLTWLQVYQAGHMVPMDQPVNALAMLDNFMAGEPW